MCSASVRTMSCGCCWNVVCGSEACRLTRSVRGLQCAALVLLARATTSCGRLLQTRPNRPTSQHNIPFSTKTTRQLCVSDTRSALATCSCALRSLQPCCVGLCHWASAQEQGEGRAERPPPLRFCAEFINSLCGIFRCHLDWPASKKHACPLTHQPRAVSSGA
jgi:hypothetical protein